MIELETELELKTDRDKDRTRDGDGDGNRGRVCEKDKKYRQRYPSKFKKFVILNSSLLVSFAY